MSAAITTAAAPLPSAGVMLRAAQISIDEDRPIMLDYWTDSKTKKCCIGVRDGIKYIVKSEQEYTSTIEDIKKVDGCFIVMTENSLYIVSQDIPVRKIVTNSPAITA
jgi:hypothetical protein